MNPPIHPLQPSFGGPPNYSTVLYPNPPSHDFGVFCIIAELMRREHKSSAPLDIILLTKAGRLGYIDFSHFSFNSGSAYTCSVAPDYSDQMIGNVLKPAAKMIGATILSLDLNDHLPQKAFFGRVEYDYHLSSLVDASRAGFEIPQWTIPPWAFNEVDDYLHGARPIILTLRETKAAQPERNSQLQEWRRFAEKLEELGYPILIVRDTYCAGVPFYQFKTWHLPSINSYIRAALYQRAKLNLMVGTGPMIWCVFSPAPYLIFKQLVPIPGWQQGWPEGWRIQEHLEVGDQFPWASHLQRLTWKDDTFENLWSEFTAMMELINA